ncbi:hypothetical protein D3C72_2260310 [compost metagenome]
MLWHIELDAVLPIWNLTSFIQRAFIILKHVHFSLLKPCAVKVPIYAFQMVSVSCCVLTNALNLLHAILWHARLTMKLNV